MPLTLKNFYKTGWQPGANTIAYYPLNGNANDYSGNGYNMSAVNTVTYETLSSGIQVAKTNNSQLEVSNFPSFAQDITVSMRVKQYENTTGYNNMGFWVKSPQSNQAGDWDSLGCSKLKHSGPSQGGNIELCMYDNIPNINVSSFNDTNWNLWTVTYSHNDTTQSLYQNGILIGSGNAGGTPSNSIGYFILGMIGYGGLSKLFLSKCIVENKIRTAQEVADYYNLTKGNYGL